MPNSGRSSELAAHGWGIPCPDPKHVVYYPCRAEYLTGL